MSAGGMNVLEDERYVVIERESLELAALEIISSMSDGQTALRLRCRTSKARCMCAACAPHVHTT